MARPGPEQLIQCYCDLLRASDKTWTELSVPATSNVTTSLSLNYYYAFQADEHAYIQQKDYASNIAYSTLASQGFVVPGDFHRTVIQRANKAVLGARTKEDVAGKLRFVILFSDE